WGGVRHQGHLASVLDRGGDVALVLRAVARHTACADLAAFGHEPPQRRGVLVVDVLDPVLAEDADLGRLLLLPALLVLLPLGGSPLRLRWHPAVSPRLPWERRPWRASSRSNLPSGPDARSSRSPNAGSDRAHRPRSPPPCACRPPGSPRNASAAGRSRRRACLG